MPLESTEDAQEYLSAIKEHLHQMASLSIEAGLNTHASIWVGLRAAFMGPPEDIETIVDMMGMWIHKKLDLPFKPKYL